MINIFNNDGKDHKTCANCVMDTTDALLTFDEAGICPRCNEYRKRIAKEWNHGKGHEQELEKLLNEIKKSGEGKKYDCILGLSGGLDSSYLLHLAVAKWGLRPFVFHVDAGWNLPVAEQNIRRICDKLGLELHVEKWTLKKCGRCSWLSSRPATQGWMRLRITPLSPRWTSSLRSWA